CHRQGIRLHFYYSHIDWSRDDYPWPTDMGGQRKRRVPGRDHHEGGYANYYKFMNNQLTELLTKYGKIGAIWFDGYWDQRHNKEKFDWGLDEQYALIHRLQPGCLVGNNSHVAAHQGEDFQIFERDLPGENKAGYSEGQEVTNSLPLETCQTMNKSWGYTVKDTNYKSLEYLIRYLVSTSGKGANLLLNIGPQPNGEIPAAALERLKGMGEWLRKYGDTIYGTTAGDIAAQDWGVTTRKGDRLFVHIFDLKEKSLHLPLKCKVKSAKLFDSNAPVQFVQDADGVILTFDTVPSGTDYIVELKTK
ncbi:MAG: alpha-L-fucosidase, partial [Alistipes sp.]|nr:alpha-L-fucosidase [Alistipes sp.]